MDLCELLGEPGGMLPGVGVEDVTGPHRRPGRALGHRSRGHPGIDDASHRATRPGGHVGYVGVNHNVSLPGEELFFSHVNLHGGPAPVRRFLPDLIDLSGNRQIDPGKVFDLELPLDQAAAGYQAMDTPAGDQGPPPSLRARATITSACPGVSLVGRPRR